MVPAELLCPTKAALLNLSPEGRISLEATFPGSGQPYPHETADLIEEAAATAGPVYQQAAVLVDHQVAAGLVYKQAAAELVDKQETADHLKEAAAAARLVDQQSSI